MRKLTKINYFIATLTLFMVFLLLVSPSTSQEKNVIAMVEDQSVTTEDLDSSLEAKLSKQQFIIEQHKIRSSLIKRAIDKRVWEIKAEANQKSVERYKMISMENYLKDQSDDRLFELVNLPELADVQLIDGDLRLYIAKMIRDLFSDEDQKKYPFSERLKESINNNILDEVLNELVSDINIKTYEIPWDFPSEIRISVSDENALLIGPEGIRVSIDLYIDFGSPHTIWDLYQHAKENRLSLKVHPLPMSLETTLLAYESDSNQVGESSALAVAFYCANEQSKFREMLENYFIIEGDWRNDALLEKIKILAEMTKIENKRFSQCQLSQQMIKKVESNKSEFKELKPIGSKEIILVNGILLSLEDAVVDELINHELRR